MTIRNRWRRLSLTTAAIIGALTLSAQAISPVELSRVMDDGTLEPADPWNLCHDSGTHKFRATATLLLDDGDTPLVDSVHWKVTMDSTVIYDEHNVDSFIEFDIPTDTAGSYTLTATCTNDSDSTDSDNDSGTVNITATDFIRVSFAGANNSPQEFDGHETVFGFPCAAGALSGQVLIVFYDDVVDASFNVQNFDIHLHAEVLPSTVTDSYLSESWTKSDGPASGSLNRTDTFDVKYQNPKEGGLYKFEFELSLEYASSGANLLLPLAGANMMEYLNQEAHLIRSWALSHKSITENANYSSIPGVTLYNVYRTWNSLSGSYFDYVFDPVDANQDAPCRCYQPTIGPDGNYGYVTADGVVVHGSKLNNMFWALFGRWWGWSETSLRLGAHLNQLGTTRRIDGTTSQNAIKLGSNIHDLLKLAPYAHISYVLTEVKRRSLVDSANLDEERLWPSPNLADYENSTFTRPTLPIKP